MGNFTNLLLCVLSICIGVRSQYPNYQTQDSFFVSGGQQYQQPSGWQYFTSYGSPSQTNYVPVNTPGNVYQGGVGLIYPYPYASQNIPSGTQFVPVSSQLNPVGSQNSQSSVADPYAGVKTEIIDVDPAEFRRLMTSQGFQPQIVSYETRRIGGIFRGYAHRPRYIVKTENKQSNETSPSQGVSKHEVQSKVTSFNKTFVIHPNENGSKILNLNFVNGVQVTEAPEAAEVPENLEEKDGNEEELENNEGGETEEKNETTTISSTTALPQKKGGRRFIDVPGGCEEGAGFSFTGGGCFDVFHLGVNRTQTNTSTTTRTSAVSHNRSDHEKVRRNHTQLH
ncbi:uncharacterized protein [Leptinotarsa decemlineata]|uniref:uncharacterized protein n=1 Tax=Leptinotarsa decemlineata TaxID=7539 RepID=UPI003D305430